MNFIKWIYIGILSFGFLMLLTGLTGDDQQVEKDFSERVNLALRQVGHQLLHAEGDSTSAIPPIEQKGVKEFVLHLDYEFNYDTLPNLLDQALTDYELTKEYRVSIHDCKTDSIMLGFNFIAVSNDQVACRGRTQIASCSNINLQFKEEESNLYLSLGLPIMMILLGSIGLYTSQSGPQEADLDTKEADSKEVSLGQSVFYQDDQNVRVVNEMHKLTFREAKLLAYFFAHPKQVLKREDIMSNVWEDEGIIVGRSLDVFISRLRKILREDTQLEIKSVHGVGYRLMVGAN